MFVYAIENPYGARYIGASGNPKRRWKTHRFRLNTGQGTNSKLQESWNQHGGAKHHFTYHVACALRRDEIHLVERDVMESWGAELNVVLEPAPIPSYTAPKSKPQAHHWKGKPAMNQAYITAGGVTKTITAWAKHLGVRPGVLHSRRHAGWTPEQVVGLELTPAKRAATLRHQEREAKAQARQQKREAKLQSSARRALPDDVDAALYLLHADLAPQLPLPAPTC